jgi:hypothetical protein
MSERMIKMPNDRRRILELALESLELKKKEIEREIADVRSELQGKAAPKKPSIPKVQKTAGGKAANRKARFTKEERSRRSERMKEYWENWRKKKEGAKKS